MGKSTCELCGKEFKFNSVPYMHVKSCQKKHGIDPPKKLVIEPVKGKFNRDALIDCKSLIKLNLSGYFNLSTMSGNERAQVNRMLQESDVVIETMLIELLKIHGIEAY